MKYNFGSDIQFTVAQKGSGTGVKYQWIASARYDMPETLFINFNTYWFEIGDKKMVEVMRHVFSHEPIHNIINHIMLGSPIFNAYDRLRLKFYKKIRKQCPKTWRDWNFF